jgi:hypothetical protein
MRSDREYSYLAGALIHREDEAVRNIVDFESGCSKALELTSFSRKLLGILTQRAAQFFDF